jgi:Cu/Ag efflux protein CusF
VQFDREIVRILDNHCVMCHREKGVAFPLVTYEQTYASRWKIRKAALARRMPPWPAVAGFGEFGNDNGLNQREADFLATWAESFGPRNNGEVFRGAADTRSAPAAVQAHIDFDRWALGKPALLLALAVNKVNPLQADQIERTTIDTRLSSDRWLRGLEYKPGDHRLVHSVSFAIRETGQWIGGWTPWYPFVSLPQGLAYRLPARSHIVAEIHYYGIKEAAVDQGSLGLYFAAQPSLRPISNLVLNAQPVSAALDGPSKKRVAAMKLAADMNVLALQPEIRSGVQSVEVDARAPDGTRQVLLFAKDIPVEWATPYVLRTPVSLRKGTELSVIEHYADDNSVPTEGISLTLSAYGGASISTDRPSAPQPPTSVQRFRLTGTVKSVDAAEGRLLVEHGDIPGLMGAMTMKYGVGEHENLRILAPGDQIQCDVVVTGATTYLENIQVSGAAK